MIESEECELWFHTDCVGLLSHSIISISKGGGVIIGYMEG